MLSIGTFANAAQTMKFSVTPRIFISDKYLNKNKVTISNIFIDKLHVLWYDI